MDISVLLAHPDKKSLNHAIARAVVHEARSLGHCVHYHDLCAEGFDPCLPAGEPERLSRLTGLVRRHYREIAAADGIVVVHPNWWGQPPAVLKGWMDRVLRPGVAYRFLEGDKGEGIPRGLLKARAALVFNTANTPARREKRVFGDPLNTLWKKCIFNFCGVKKTHRRVFSVVVTSTPAQRKRWLTQARNDVRRQFPRP